MNFEDIKNAISPIHGASFCGLDTLTNVSLRGGKKNPMLGRVQKVHERAVVLLFNQTDVHGYSKIVRKRLLAEGKDPDTFELKPRAWGTRIENTPFIEHKDAHYLECIFMRAGKSYYLLDGEPIAKEDIEGLPVVKVSEESQGGVDNKVIIRTYAVDSITKMRIFGDEVPK